MWLGSACRDPRSLKGELPAWHQHRFGSFRFRRWGSVSIPSKVRSDTIMSCLCIAHLRKTTRGLQAAYSKFKPPTSLLYAVSRATEGMISDHDDSQARFALFDHDHLKERSTIPTLGPSSSFASKCYVKLGSVFDIGPFLQLR